MDIRYWTFPHLGGKWSLYPGKVMQLTGGWPGKLDVVRWVDKRGVGSVPVVRDNHNHRDVEGTVWKEGPAVQEGNAPAKDTPLLPPKIITKTPFMLAAVGEKSGGSVDYYQVKIENPTTEGRDPYTAECNDIIEALGMDYAEGNQFKALWRSCAERTLGKKKAGGDSVYDAEKSVFFAKRTLAKRKAQQCN